MNVRNNVSYKLGQADPLLRCFPYVQVEVFHIYICIYNIVTEVPGYLTEIDAEKPGDVGQDLEWQTQSYYVAVFHIYDM